MWLQNEAVSCLEYWEQSKLVDWYDREAHKLHPIEPAAKVHADFVGIHPFIDGNGVHHVS